VPSDDGDVNGTTGHTLYEHVVEGGNGHGNGKPSLLPQAAATPVSYNYHQSGEQV
jgi:hypothetical protein